MRIFQNYPQTNEASGGNEKSIKTNLGISETTGRSNGHLWSEQYRRAIVELPARTTLYLQTRYGSLWHRYRNVFIHCVSGSNTDVRHGNGLLPL